MNWMSCGFCSDFHHRCNLKALLKVALFVITLDFKLQIYLNISTLDCRNNVAGCKLPKRSTEHSDIDLQTGAQSFQAKWESSTKGYNEYMKNSLPPEQQKKNSAQIWRRVYTYISVAFGVNLKRLYFKHWENMIASDGQWEREQLSSCPRHDKSKPAATNCQPPSIMTERVTHQC